MWVRPIKSLSLKLTLCHVLNTTLGKIIIINPRHVCTARVIFLRNASIFDQDCETIERRACSVAIHITVTTMATICVEKSKSKVEICVCDTSFCRIFGLQYL